MTPYERLLGDACAATRLFARGLGEVAWEIVDRLLASGPRAEPYDSGSWGPARPSAWLNATAAGTTAVRSSAAPCGLIVAAACRVQQLPRRRSSRAPAGRRSRIVAARAHCFQRRRDAG